MNRLRTRLRASIASGPLVLLDFISGGLDPRITFSRGSNATLVDSTGKITYAPANLLLQSQTFDNASWGKTSTTVTADATTAPDGTPTADKLISNNGVSISATNITQTITAATATYTYSIYAKKAEFNRLNLVVRDDVSAGNNAQVTVSLEDGSVTAAATAGGTFTGASATVSSAANGFYRVALTFTSTGATALRVRVFPNDSVATTGNGTSGIFIWGAQLEPVTYQTVPGTYNATTTAAYYGPRFDYDPVTLAPKGLLIEEARTNLLTYSEQFNNWTAENVTVTSNAIASPDGATTADKVIASAVNGGHGVYNSATLTLSTSYTFTAYFKSAEQTFAALSGYDNTTFYATFNLGTGAVVNTLGLSSSSITNVGNGWYRCSITRTAAAAGTGYFYARGLPSDVFAGYTGNGTSGIYVWGAQLEAGAFATSYIPTVASTVTRSADVASMTGTNFSSWYNPVEGTLIANVVPTNSIASNTRAATITDGTNRVVDIYIDTTVWRSFNGTTNVTPASSTAVLNSTVNFASAYKSGDYAAAMNGSAVGTAATAGVQSSNKLTIGANITSSAGFLNGHIRSIAYYNTRLPNATLQTLTAPPLVTTLTMSFTNQAYTVGV